MKPPCQMHENAFAPLEKPPVNLNRISILPSKNIKKAIKDTTFYSQSQVPPSEPPPGGGSNRNRTLKTSYYHHPITRFPAMRYPANHTCCEALPIYNPLSCNALPLTVRAVRVKKEKQKEENKNLFLYPSEQYLSNHSISQQNVP